MKLLNEKVARLINFHQQDPSNINLLLDIVNCYRLMRDIKSAQHYLDIAKKIDEISCQSMQGLLYLTANDFNNAQLVFEQLLQQHDCANTRYHLSFCHYMQQDIEQAYQILLPSITEESSNDSLVLMTKLMHYRNELDQAIAMLEKISNPTVEVLGQLALLHFDALNEEQAKHCANHAMAIDPSNHEALCVIAYIKLSKHQCGSQVFIDLIQQAPNDGRLYSALGNAQMLELNNIDAEKSLTTSAELMPDFAGNWLALGWCQLINDKITEAKFSFETARDLDKSFAESHGGLAIVAALEEQFDEAKRLITIATKLDKSCHFAMLAQALLHNHDDPKLAKEYYDKAIKSMAISAGLINSKEISEHLLSKTIH